MIDDLQGVDVYLIDQILKGRIPPGARVLDVGCGGGRNLRWFFARGYDTVALDRQRSDATNVLAEGSQLPLPDASFDVVLSIAVLHFAKDAAHLRAMLDELHRVLKPGGLCFARFATTLGMDGLAPGWQTLPDGSQRFLLDPGTLHAWAEERRVQLLDPFKTTVVENQRSMATWVWARAESDGNSPNNRR